MDTTRRTTALALAALLGAASLAPMAPARADGEESKILLVLDASGSMNGQDPSGGTKLQAAKKALTSAVSAMPDDAQVGLRVFGATYGGKDKKTACADTQLVHPIGPLDRGGLNAAIAGFKAQGDTPIAYSLQQAVKDLGGDGKRHIILVSDGEETCVPDPCPQIRDIMKAGISLQIDTVGFGVNDKARKQLQCIADAGKGTYYDASNAEELESSLTRISKRSVRPFAIAGEPLAGGTTPDTAPLAVPGQYTDTSVGTAQGSVDRYYRLTRTAPNTTLRFGFAGRAPYASGTDSFALGGWEAELTTTEGALCTRWWDTGSDVAGLGKIIGGALWALPLDPRASSPNTDAKKCGEATDFIVKLTRNEGTAGEIPIQIRVIEEAAVVDAAALPGGFTQKLPTDGRTLTSPASGTPLEVIGGVGFNDAEELQPGTYVANIVSGEQLFFRTKLAYGQSAVISLDGPTDYPPLVAVLGSLDTISTRSDVYGPDLGRITTMEWGATVQRVVDKKVQPPTLPFINVIPEVQWRNRWDSPSVNYGRGRSFDMDGYYYFSIAMNTEDKARGIPVPLRFSFAVTGDPQPAPETVTGPSTEPSVSGSVEASGTPGAEAPETDASSAPTTAASSQEPVEANDTSGALLPIVGGSLIGVGVLGGAGYLLWRRRNL